ncbi:MAG: DUF2079 domain-containing protein [Bacteroidetes bacterium]|nr:DUF2079 domain-containing protein [Bacteroidota bacterium]
MDNLVIYKNEILAFWGNLGFFNKDLIAKLFSYSFAMVCLVSWMIHRDREWDFLRIFTLVFLLSIMIFPNYQQGLRYFIPILPCLFLLFLLGYKSFSERVKIPAPMSQIALLILFIYLYLAPNMAYTESIAKRSNENGLNYSPYSAANQKIMREIQSIIPQSDTLITSYPRAFALFTQRHTYIPSPDITLDNAIREIASFHQFYLLDYYPLRKKSIETLANAIHLNPSKYYIDTLATNMDYGLYKCTAR